jgi:hypothetical protein
MVVVLQLRDEGVKLGEKGAPSSLEGALLARAEDGEIGAGHFVEGALERIEARLEIACGGAEGRRFGGGSGLGQGASRIAQERLPHQGVLDGAVGRHPRIGFAAGESVSRGGVGEPYLLAGGQRAKSTGEREGERSAIEPRGERGGQTAGEGEASKDPALLVTEVPGDRRGREVVVVVQRGDDAHLVHGARGPGGSVATKQARLSLDGRDVLDDDGDLALSLGPPVLEALEAVEHLERPLLARGDAKGHRGELGVGIGARAAKRGERKAQSIDRHETDEAHGVGSSRERSW